MDGQIDEQERSKVMRKIVEAKRNFFASKFIGKK